MTFLRVGARNETQFPVFGSYNNTSMEVVEQLAVNTFMVHNYSDVNTIYPTQYFVLNDYGVFTSYRLRDANMYNLEFM